MGTDKPSPLLGARCSRCWPTDTDSGAESVGEPTSTSDRATSTAVVCRAPLALNHICANKAEAKKKMAFTHRLRSMGRASNKIEARGGPT